MKRLAWLIIIVAILSGLPWVLESYYVKLLTSVLIFAVFAMSVDLITGYLGRPTLGHAAYFGVAAYVAALLSKNAVPGWWVNLAVAVAAAAIVAALFGLLLLRTKGGYFLVMTAALDHMLWSVAYSWRGVTGGDQGISGVSRPELGIIAWSLEGKTYYFYFVLAFFLLSFLMMYVVTRSPFGHVIAGIRENEQRMQALGYNTWLYKYVWFIISGVFAGLAGVLEVYDTGFVSPSDLSIRMSSMGLLMVLVGGGGALYGAIIGAGFIVLLENFISAYTDRWPLILGLLYAVVVMLMPGGLLGLVNRIAVKRRVSA